MPHNRAEGLHSFLAKRLLRYAVTPVSSSLQGMIGTFFTSLVIGAIVAIFQREKG